MSLSVAVQMDPIASINPVGDSTFAMMLEAEKRGHRLDYYTVNTLGLRDNLLTAEVAPISVFDKPKGEHFKLGDARRTNLADYDVVLMRQDPPFDMIFVGIDVIGGYLTEINVTSPTGIREIKRFGGPDIAPMIWDAIEKRRA